MIHNPDKFIEGFWNWDILKGCFGDTKIKVMDIDGAIERNGKFLFIETKSLDASEDIPMGQHIFFKMLVKNNGFIVIVVWGDKDNPVRAKTYTINSISEPFDCDIDKLKDMVSQWFEYANKKK